MSSGPQWGCCLQPVHAPCSRRRWGSGSRRRHQMGRLDTQAVASLLHMMSSWSRKDNIIKMEPAKCTCTCTCASTSTYNSGKVFVLTYTVAGRQVPPRTPHQGWKRSRLATRQSLEIQSTAKPRTGQKTISKKSMTYMPHIRTLGESRIHH